MKGYIKKNAMSVGLAVTAFLAAAILYSVLIYTEKKITASEEKVEVCIAKCEVPAGTDINELNYSQYFEKSEIYISAIPNDSIADERLLADKTANYNISEGTIITDGMLRFSYIGKNGMEEPVLVGLKADDIFQVAGGILRSGDRVHIYIIGDDGKASLRWKNVCIEDSFDNSGNRLGINDEGRAMRFNIFLEKRDVEEFYECLDSGGIRIVKL